MDCKRASCPLSWSDNGNFYKTFRKKDCGDNSAYIFRLEYRMAD